MTFSIVAFDPDTRSWGIAVASKFLAVGAGTKWLLFLVQWPLLVVLMMFSRRKSACTLASARLSMVGARGATGI